MTVAKNEEIRFIVHDLSRNTAQPANPAFTENPLSYTSMRASIGLIDAPPKTGTFKLKVGDQTTATVLTWPLPLHVSQVDVFDPGAAPVPLQGSHSPSVVNSTVAS